jgi:protein tyrosine phosphatase
LLFISLSFSCFSSETRLNISNFSQVWNAFLAQKKIDHDSVALSEYRDYEFSLLEEFSEQQSNRHRPSIDQNDRYPESRPFAENKITLADGTEMSASFVQLPHERIKYHNFIATQAPLETNIHLFWQMIIENRINQIVMLTELFNVFDNELCYRYWPFEKKEKLILKNGIEITLIQKQKVLKHLDENFEIRKFKVRIKDEVRVMTHYWYRNWLDNAAPSQSQTIMSLIKAVESDKSSRASKSPILVHCAAGVGRSGVFITLYHLMQRAKYGDQKLDLFSLVAYLRWQRAYMVSMPSQYQFCYEEAIRLQSDSP